MLRVYIISIIIGILTSGCASNLCYPPSYYAPQPGAPYTAEEAFVSASDGAQLVGTLTLPSDVAPPFPAVILITGSSAQNRDMMDSRIEPACFYRPFRQIADLLSRQGIAVLRMDDRGVGCSEGGPLTQATTADRADDIRAGLNYLRKHEKIDNRRFGLIGYSEGSTIGQMIAETDPTIRGLVFMAAYAGNPRKWYVIKKMYEVERKESLTDADRERKEAEILHGLDLYLSSGKASPWNKFFFDYDPLPGARKVSCPVLILHGNRDSSTPFEHAYILAEAMRSGGNKDVTVKILVDHNHLFLEDRDGRKSGYLELVKHTNQLSEFVMKNITDWVTSRLAP
jgi:hypothetical protein